MTEITGAWINEDGTEIAVEINNGALIRTHYGEHPKCTRVVALGNEWIPIMPVLVDGEWLRP